jgi:hypothetical protein
MRKEKGKKHYGIAHSAHKHTFIPSSSDTTANNSILLLASTADAVLCGKNPRYFILEKVKSISTLHLTLSSFSVISPSSLSLPFILATLSFSPSAAPPTGKV